MVIRVKLAVSFAVFLVACQYRFDADGAGCEADGGCPSGYACSAERVCRTMRTDGGGGTGGGSTAGGSTGGGATGGGSTGGGATAGGATAGGATAGGATAGGATAGGATAGGATAGGATAGGATAGGATAGGATAGGATAGGATAGGATAGGATAGGATGGGSGACTPNPCTELNKTVCTDVSGTALCSCVPGHVLDPLARCVAADAGLYESALLLHDREGASAIAWIDGAGLQRLMPIIPPADAGLGFSNWLRASAVITEQRAYVLYTGLGGGGGFVSISTSSGQATVLIPSLAFSEWDEVFPVSCAEASCYRFVFHKRAPSTAAVVDFVNTAALDGGSWTPYQRDIISIDAPHYTHWWPASVGRAPGSNSVIGLYSQGDGGVATLEVNVAGGDAGMFVRGAGGPLVTAWGNMSAGWDILAPTWAERSPGPVFAYSQVQTGANFVGFTGGAANVLATWPNGSYASWHDLAFLDNELIVFYRRDTGASAWGHLNPTLMPPFQARTGTLGLDAGYDMVVAPLPVQ
ncbi:MAG: hypothetical protein JNJ54_06315 [Myxococcaceae bacterium]|nr:hypothetical protein [Myxococcaceae bacterium]